VPITIDNITYNSEVVNAGSKTISFTNVAGDDTDMIMMLNINGNYGAVSATYNGEAMTKYATLNESGFFSDVVVFEKKTPATGANDIVVSFGAAYNDDLSWYIMGLRNTSGILQSKTGQATSSPIQAAFDSSILEGSIVLGAACGLDTLTAGAEIELPAGTYNGYDAGKYTTAGAFPGEVVFMYNDTPTAGAFTGETNHDDTGVNKNSGLILLEVGIV